MGRGLRFHPRTIAVLITVAAAGFAANPESRRLSLTGQGLEPVPEPAIIAQPFEALTVPSVDGPAAAAAAASAAESSLAGLPDAALSATAAPHVAVLEVQTGRASYYASSLAGRRTASGERYDPRALVAAHRHLPFGSVLRVTNPANNRSVRVRVIDRGPFAKGRVLDLSRRAAEDLGMIRSGHAAVRIEVLSYGE